MQKSQSYSTTPTQTAISRHSLRLIALFVVALFSRILLQGRMLYHWDSVNFAFALEQFDISKGQPHAPGYLLYVLLGRAAYAITNDAQQAYVLLSALGSAFAALAVYALGKALWNSIVGWLSALFLLSSPLFWFYGSIALPHTLDAMAVSIAAWLSWRMWHRDHQSAILLALWLGFAGGLRQQTLVFMFPLAVMCGWWLSWRWKIGIIAVLSVTTLAWMLPLFALSGGMQQYFSTVKQYSGHFNQQTSIFLDGGLWGLQYNISRLIKYTAWGWGIAALPLLIALWYQWRNWRSWLHNPRLWFLLVWAIPSLVFYTLIHMGQQGLIFTFLPILMLLSGLASAYLWQATFWDRWLPLCCILANIALFLAAPSQILGSKVLSLQTLREHDQQLTAQLQAVQQGMPEGGLLLAHEWRFPQYYLRDIALLPYRYDVYAGVASEPDFDAQALEQISQASSLVWYEPEIDNYNRSREQQQNLSASNGVRLRILPRQAQQHFQFDSQGFEVNP